MLIGSTNERISAQVTAHFTEKEDLERKISELSKVPNPETFNNMVAANRMYKSEVCQFRDHCNLLAAQARSPSFLTVLQLQNPPPIWRKVLADRLTHSNVDWSVEVKLYDGFCFLFCQLVLVSLFFLVVHRRSFLWAWLYSSVLLFCLCSKCTKWSLASLEPFCLPWSHHISVLWALAI